MNIRRTSTAVVAAAGLALTGALVSPASAHGPGHGPGHGHGHGHDGVSVVTTGLDGPFGLDDSGRKGWVVAESVSGEVTRVDRDGSQRVLFDGAPGVAGVAAGGRSVFAVLGGPNEEGTPPEGDFAPSSVVRAGRNGSHPTVIADLLQYELDHNPDGQVQLVDGQPVDALSNPFAMNLSRFGLLVADGGANDVLRVDPWTGEVSTFFVPPTVKIPACDGAQANPGTVGCDPVPTGIAVQGRSVYVSTLGAEVPGAGRVYQLDGRTGKVQRVWTGLTSPTGIAVDPKGNVYVSEVLFGAPPDDAPPPDDFDPATVGRITRIAGNGRMTYAAVTMPTGLDWAHGSLYASAWSIASFLGIEHAGQVVRVGQGAFHAATSG